MNYRHSRPDCKLVFSICKNLNVRVRHILPAVVHAAWEIFVGRGPEQSARGHVAGGGRRARLQAFKATPAPQEEDASALSHSPEPSNSILLFALVFYWT